MPGSLSSAPSGQLTWGKCDTMPQAAPTLDSPNFLSQSLADPLLNQRKSTLSNVTGSKGKSLPCTPPGTPHVTHHSHVGAGQAQLGMKPWVRGAEARGWVLLGLHPQPRVPMSGLSGSAHFTIQAAEVLLRSLPGREPTEAPAPCSPGSLGHPAHPSRARHVCSAKAGRPVSCRCMYPRLLPPASAGPWAPHPSSWRCSGHCPSMPSASIIRMHTKHLLCTGWGGWRTGPLSSRGWKGQNKVKA